MSLPHTKFSCATWDVSSFLNPLKSHRETSWSDSSSFETITVLWTLELLNIVWHTGSTPICLPTYLPTCNQPPICLVSDRGWLAIYAGSCKQVYMLRAAGASLERPTPPTIKAQATPDRTLGARGSKPSGHVEGRRRTGITETMIHNSCKAACAQRLDRYTYVCIQVPSTVERMR